MPIFKNIEWIIKSFIKFIKKKFMKIERIYIYFPP